MKSLAFTFILVLNLTTFLVNGEMNIHVRTVGGKQIALNANISTTIGNLKDQLPMSPLMALSFEGTELLNDAEYLSDLGIGADAELHIQWSKELAVKYLKNNGVLTEYTGNDGERALVHLHALILLLNARNTIFDDFRKNVYALKISGLNIHSLRFEIDESTIVNASLLCAAFSAADDSLNVDLVRLLVTEFGMDVNAKYIVDDETMFPLKLCCSELHGFEIAEFLVANGADVNAKIEGSVEYSSILGYVQNNIEITQHKLQLETVKKIERLLISQGAHL